jgi:hypothetical protein
MCGIFVTKIKSAYRAVRNEYLDIIRVNFSLKKKVTLKFHELSKADELELMHLLISHCICCPEKCILLLEREIFDGEKGFLENV